MTTGRKVIAIVDDDPDMRSVVNDLVRLFGWNTETYASAHEFMAAVPTTSAGCLLVDVELGDVTGIEMVRRLIALEYRFPTIFMTGSMSGVHRAQAKEIGCVAYLQKPFSSEELKAAIAKALSGPPASVSRPRRDHDASRDAIRGQHCRSWARTLFKRSLHD